MTSGGERLIVFTRYPEPGRTKTRLIPALGPEGAADLHRRMTEHTLARARALAERRGTSLEVRFEGGGQALMAQWLGTRLASRPQGEGDLGDRMARAIADALREGAARAIVIGTDCPALASATLAAAFDALQHNDLVLGPATDGGYYLIGLRREAPALFADMPWGTGDVLKRTLAAAKAAGLSFALLGPLDDVDRPEDLPLWERAQWRISVIIPTLNEAAALPATLAAIQPEADVEVIVADGGSSDGTTEAALAAGARLVAAERGKARQMNAGAAAASGDVLLFLHADTRLPQGFDAHVRDALGRPGAVAGAFAFRVDSPRRGLRVIEWLANWRSRRLGMPYGDQGIFVKADAFREAGGYPDLPVMEDFELMRRLKRRGRIVLARAAAVTSGRRWLRLGLLRTTLVNQAMIVGYLLGVSPERLARWYRGGTRVSAL